MDNEKRFMFLEECEFFLERRVMRDQKTDYIRYEFGREYKNKFFSADIFIPKNEKGEIYYGFLMESENDIKSIMQIENTPNWFKELYEKSKNEVNKRDKVRNLFK